MKKLIQNYSDALEAHMEARKQEVFSKVTVQKTHFALLKAKEALRYAEHDMLTDMERV